MILPDIANVVAGAYKGYMNAAGQSVDPTYLAYVIASTSALAGGAKFLSVWRQNANPIHLITSRMISSLEGREHKVERPVVEGLSVGFISVPVGALEIALGYGLGYVAQKIST